MGLPCTFAVARKAGAKTDNDAVRGADRASSRRWCCSARYNERMYLAELAQGRAAAVYIPAAFPARSIRRAHRHAVHGLRRRDLPRAGSLQRAVRRAVPHPAARHARWTASTATPSRLRRDFPWDADAQGAARPHRGGAPVLIRISAAKTLRDAAERAALDAGAERVGAARPWRRWSRRGSGDAAIGSRRNERWPTTVMTRQPSRPAAPRRSPGSTGSTSSAILLLIALPLAVGALDGRRCCTPARQSRRPA